MGLWEKWKGKGKKPFYIRLVAKGRVLWTSPGYARRRDRDNLMKSVQVNSRSKKVVDYEKLGKPLPRRRIG